MNDQRQRTSLQAFVLEVLALALFLFTVGALAAFAQTNGQTTGAGSGSGRELPEANVRDGILELVSLRHPPDGDRDKRAWLSLGTGAPRVIVSMLTSEERVYSRVRMIEGLQYFEGPEAADAREAVRRMLETSAEPILKQASLGTLGRWGRAEDLDLISKYLNDPRPSTRQAARESLRLIASRSGDARAQQKWQETQRDQPAQIQMRGPIAVSSSDQTPSADFVGEWRGQWIEPRAGVTRSVHETAGLVTSVVTLTFRLFNSTPNSAPNSMPSAVLTADGKAAGQALVIDRIKSVPGQPQRLTGIVRIGARSDAFEAELVRQAESGPPGLGLLLRVPAWSATYVARKP